MGWVARCTSPDTGANVQLVTRDATAPEDSVISVHTDDVDGAYEEALKLGYEIVHPITQSPGVCAASTVTGHAPVSGYGDPGSDPDLGAPDVADRQGADVGYVEPSEREAAEQAARLEEIRKALLLSMQPLVRGEVEIARHRWTVIGRPGEVGRP